MARLYMLSVPSATLGLDALNLDIPNLDGFNLFDGFNLKVALLAMHLDAGIATSPTSDIG